MKRLAISIIFMAALLFAPLCANAQYDFIRPVKDVIPGGYNFWVYTPTEYYYTLNETPVIIFLHGQSLCGRDLNRVRRYGPLDAIVKGRQVDALVVVPQNPGGSWNPKKINDAGMDQEELRLRLHQGIRHRHESWRIRNSRLRWHLSQ